jgi:multisubunit Na+/H+ antiporter MnhC subunit
VEQSVRHKCNALIVRRCVRRVTAFCFLFFIFYSTIPFYFLIRQRIIMTICIGLDIDRSSVKVGAYVSGIPNGGRITKPLGKLLHTSSSVSR